MLLFGILHSDNITKALYSDESFEPEREIIYENLPDNEFLLITEKSDINIQNHAGVIIFNYYFHTYGIIKKDEERNEELEKYKDAFSEKRQEYLEDLERKKQSSYVEYSNDTYVYEQPVYDIQSDGLTPSKGVNYYGEQKETYYNLSMDGVVGNAQNSGIEGEYWVREDGVKMYGDYVIVAANQDVHPYGSTVETSLGTGIVLDTGGFAEGNPTQVDIAADW